MKLIDDFKNKKKWKVFSVIIDQQVEEIDL